MTTHAFDVGKYGETLPQLAVEVGLLDFVHDNPVAAFKISSFSRVTSPMMRMARRGREGLVSTPFPRQAEFESYLAHLVLEEEAQRLISLSVMLRAARRRLWGVLSWPRSRRLLVGALDDVRVERACARSLSCPT